MSAKSITIPDAATGPRTWTSTRKECPCSRRHLWPSGRSGSRWAASKVNSRKTSTSGDAQELVGLQAQPPAGMGLAVLDGQRRIGLAFGSVHGLEQQAVDAEVLELRRRRP